MPVKTFEASDKTRITLSCVKVPLSSSAGLGLPVVLLSAGMSVVSHLTAQGWPGAH